jgi:hypothetical protein
MRKEPPNDQEKGWLSDLATVFRKRSGQYERAYVVAGYPVGTAYAITHVVMKMGRAQADWSDKQIEYPNYALARKSLAPEDAWRAFEALIETGDLTINGWPILKFEGRLNWLFDCESSNPEINVGWYAKCAHFSDNNAKGAGEDLVAVDAPYYPSAADGASYWTGISTQYRGSASGVTLVLPDFRARITGVGVGISSLNLGVEKGPAASEDVLVKYFARGPGYGPAQGDLSVEMQAPVVELGFTADQLTLILFEHRSGDILDRRSWHSRTPSGRTDVRYVIRGEDLRAIVDAGESQWAEFKRSFPEADKLAKPVTAFSNSPAGGALIVGIDEETHVIVGVDNWNPDTVTNAIRSYVDPNPVFTVRQEELDGKRLVVIEVEPGDDPPYLHRDLGPLVRANATNRTAKRYELDEIYRRTRGQTGG